MTVGGGLINAILRTTAAHHRPECENLAGGFSDQLIIFIGKYKSVPQRFTFTGDEDRISNFEVNDRVELRKTEGNVVGIDQCFGLRQL